MSSRIPLPAVAGLGIAAGLIAVSYGHIHAVALDAGAVPWEAAIIAATVDGLIVMALSTIALAGRHGVKPPKVAKAALIVGVAATGAANLVHGVSYGWTGVAVAIWVPLVAEVAYLLAMAAIRIVRQAADSRPAICGQDIPVAALMTRVAAGRREAEEAAARGAAAMAARPVICGHVVPVATVTARVATPDIRPVICGAAISVATAMASIPAAPKKVVICGGQDLGADIGLATHLAMATAEQEAPVICGAGIPVAAVTAPLTDDRPVICGGRLVSVAEVLARTPVATAKPAAKKRTPATAKPAATSDREDIVLEWLTAPGSPDNRVATATGPDIVRVLAGHGHQVSERTARRVLKEVREALGEVATA